MNKTIYPVFLMILVFFISCEEDTDINPPSDQEIIDEVMMQIGENETIFEDVFSDVRNKVSPEIILPELHQSQSKREFFLAMENLTKNVFADAFERNRGLFEVDELPEGLSPEDKNELTLALITSETNPSMPPFFDPNGDNNLFTSLQSEIIEQERSDPHKKWIILSSISYNGTPVDVPTEQVSLNYEEIRLFLQQASIIESSSEPAAAPANDTTEWLAPIVPITTGLLLPAIQKVREPARKTNSEDSYSLWLEEMFNSSSTIPIDSVWDPRFLLNRLDASTLYGSLLVILSREKSPEELDELHLALLRARFQVVQYFVWDELWRRNK